MKITDIQTQTIVVPLKSTFKTALRTIDAVENVLVTVVTDSEHVGIGSAAPTAVITGETLLSLLGGIEHIRDNLLGMDIADHESVFQRLNSCLVGNMSAKAGVDMAIYDIIGKSFGTPLYALLGGLTEPIMTDITISLDSLEKMVAESREKIGQGFTTLKVKVGGDPELDINRLAGIRAAIGPDIQIRIDANQGWTAKEAIYVGKELERKNIQIELMEQPVIASDFEGLRFVRENVSMPVYADESIFSPRDALDLIAMNAIDGINIKLMKCGGIYNGLKIAAIAESAGVPCMIGSMMECHISVTAAAHLAASRAVISSYDLDAPLFCSSNPAEGGITYQGAQVSFSSTAGLGIQSIVTS